MRTPSALQVYRREAIKLLSDAYLDGRAFLGAPAIRQYIVDQLGTPPRHINFDMASRWDAIARRSLEPQNVSVTNPVRPFTFERDPQASRSKLTFTRSQLVRGDFTTMRRRAQTFRSDAAQPDATPAAIALSDAYSTIVVILERAYARSTGQTALPIQ
jgi:hypothetical protein